MNTVVLTDEQLAFLQSIVSHDTDLIEPMVRGTELSFETSEDDFDVVALRDLMSTTANALCGHQETPGVHAFHGSRETNAGGFVLDCDRSLDEGPVVLTARHVDPKDPFMGWWSGWPEGKFVEVPRHLAGRIAACIEVALDDENACDNIGIDMHEVNDMATFVEVLQRVAAERVVVNPPGTWHRQLAGRTEIQRPDAPAPLAVWWEIVGPFGVEWVGQAKDELAALDAWANSNEMETYSDAILRNVREGDGPSAFRIDGVMNATCSNYNVVVQEHTPTREVIVHLKAKVVRVEGDDDNTVEQRLLEGIDAIQADGVVSIDVTLVEDSPDVGV